MERENRHGHAQERRNPSQRCAVQLADLPDGGLRVVMDDLRKSDTAGMWQHRTFVTFKDYPPGMLADPVGLS